MRKLFTLLLVLLAATTALAYHIPAQTIVPLASFQNAEGQGEITPESHTQAITYSAHRLPVMAQSIMGLPTYSAITRWRIATIPLLWWILAGAFIFAITIPARTLLQHHNIRELPFVGLVNKLYVYMLVAFILLILWMGTIGAFQFSMFYLAANLAALVLLDWFGKHFAWYRDFKMGLAADNSVLGYAVSPTSRILGIAGGTLLIGVYLASGNVYIAAPTYAAGGSFQDTLSRVIPVLPEDLLWFKIVPLALLILFMKAIFYVYNADLSIKETRDNHPRTYFTTLVVGVVLVSTFGGLVLWPSYHDATYGGQAQIIAQQTGRPVQEVKEELLNSVSNFGYVGTFVTLVTGSTISTDIMHAVNNLSI